MPIDVDDVEPELEAAEWAFEDGGGPPERGLDVSDASLVQLRKACRTLAGAESMFDGGYYTLVIEGAFTALEKSLLFWLVAEAGRDPAEPPGSHTTAIHRAGTTGLITNDLRFRLVDLWEANRSRIYYQDAIATESRARTTLALASLLHDRVLDAAGRSHDCRCHERS